MRKITDCRFRRFSTIAPAMFLGLAILALPTRQANAGGFSFAVDTGKASFGVGVGDGGSQIRIDTNRGSASIALNEPLPIPGALPVLNGPQRPPTRRADSRPLLPPRLEPPAPMPRADAPMQRGKRPSAQRDRFPDLSRRPGPDHRGIGPGPRGIGPGPREIGPGPRGIGPGPREIGPGPREIGPDARKGGANPGRPGVAPTSQRDEMRGAPRTQFGGLRP